MKNITGFVLVRDYQGKAIPVAGRTMYAYPDRFDALFMDGTAWAPTYIPAGTPPVGYERAIIRTTDATGAFNFSLPQTSETFVSGGGSVNWLITDPITKITFRGPVLDALPLSIDVRDLVVSHGWEVIPTTTVNVGAVNFRTGRQQFDNGTGAEQVIAIAPPMPNANYTAISGGATDDVGDVGYSSFVLPGQTSSQFTLRISASVPSPRNAKIPWAVFG